MRDRQKTIQALRRLAERPGTPEEGQTARRLLAQFGALEWIVTPFDYAKFPKGTRVFYCYWCYRNRAATIVQSGLKHFGGETWMCLKFDHLKQSRWVPVTSPLGCHIADEPFDGDVAETLYRMTLDWREHDKELAALIASMKANGLMGYQHSAYLDAMARDRDAGDCAAAAE